MKPSITSHATNKKLFIILFILLILLIISLTCGRYPLSIKELLSGNQMQVTVLFNLRLPRTIVGFLAGFALAVCGYIYQMVFHNQLASPDIIGVASGASAGAAFGILFFGSALSISLCSFTGSLIAVLLALGFAAIDKTGGKATVILAGIAIHSICQMILMCLKLMADPFKQLASIEFWMMGGLSGVTADKITVNLLLCLLSLIALFLLHRQSILLSADESEAKTLGVNVATTRLIILLFATIAVSSIISLTGLISFVGLIAPHCARKLIKNNTIETMLFSGFIGSIILILADILARSISTVELPISIFTSLIGAPFLIYLIFRKRSLS